MVRSRRRTPAARTGQVHDLLAEGLLQRRRLALDAGEAVPDGGRRLLGPGRQRGHRSYTLTGSCSAHYFDVDDSLVTYAWYGQGTRFLDISNPENPIQVAYYRPDGGNVWASYLHKGYIYTADAARGVDVLRFKRGAKAASAAKKEVNAPKMSAAQQKFLRGLGKSFQPDPTAGFICMLPA